MQSTLPAAMMIENKSDEELAEEDDLASADLLAVDREGWPRLVVHLEQLYRVGELHGLAAAKAWLTEPGIAWREMVQAPRRPPQHRPAHYAVHPGPPGDVPARRRPARM